MKHLYHGSVVRGLKVLEPKKRFTPSETIDFSAIYATPSKTFAITHSFPWSSEDGFDVEIKDGQVTLLCPKLSVHKLIVPISIYVISDKDFVRTEVEETGYTWHSIESSVVMEEIRYETVVLAMEKEAGFIEYI